MAQTAYESNPAGVASAQSEYGTSGYGDNSSNDGNQGNAPAAIPRMQLTKAELDVLQQCRIDSFYQRSLPLSVALMATVQVLVRRGVLGVHPRWGAVPKIIGAGALGFFMGKVSYASTCRDKLLKVEGGTIAQAVKSRRDGQSPMGGFGQLRDHDQQRQQSVSGSSSNELHGEPDDSEPAQSGTAAPLSGGTTYESLRNKHRQEQDASVAQRRAAAFSDLHLRSQQQQQQAGTWQQPSSQAAAGSGGSGFGQPAQGKAKNKYGDVWEE